MADVFGLNPTSLGQINEAGSDLALFLKLFSGEVLTTYRENLTTEGTVMTHTVPQGAKSSQFRLMGEGSVARHVAGKNVLVDDDPDGAKYLTQIKQGEREVFLDRPLIAVTTVDNWEEARNSFQARQPIAMELARQLAKRTDRDRLLLMIKAAGASLDSTSSYPTAWATSGTKVTDANAGTDGSALLDSIRQLEEAFSDADVPEMDRHVALKPSHYNLLVQNQDLLNRDFNTDNGIFSDGTVYRAWGMMLHKTTNIPTTNLLSDDQTGVNGEDYAVDARNTVAVAWQSEGFASAEAEAIGVEAEDKIELQGALILGKVVSGHEIIRPVNFGWIVTA